MNEAIRVSPVRLIDETGEQLGIVETPKALYLAQSKGLDLVEISPTAKPPVCKIIDWGKFQYQEAKKQQDAKAKQKKIDIKGVRFRPSTDGNDLNFKLKQTEKFLLKGNKVKVEIVLRGREKAFANQSREKLQLFVDKIEIPIKIEQGIKRQFNGFNVLISSNKAN
jgi:translation initiation factor IF-3